MIWPTWQVKTYNTRIVAMRLTHSLLNYPMGTSLVSRQTTANSALLKHLPQHIKPLPLEKLANHFSDSLRRHSVRKKAHCQGSPNFLAWRNSWKLYWKYWQLPIVWLRWRDRNLLSCCKDIWMPDLDGASKWNHSGGSQSLREVWHKPTQSQCNSFSISHKLSKFKGWETRDCAALA